MRWRQVIALWVVCLALAADWFLVEQRRPAPPPDERTAEAERRPFLDFAASGVAGVRLERGGRRLVVRRTGVSWRVVEPADADVPADLVAAFMQALLDAREITQAATRTEDLAAFGLGDDATRVVIDVGGQAPVEVALGGPNPTGTAVYARRGARVVLIGRDVRYYEDLLFGAIPSPAVPSDAARGDVG